MAVVFLGGPAMVVGLLAGATASGMILAIFLANPGGVWNNAKKMIEAGVGRGRGCKALMAAVVGDPVWDPFKDTAAPSLNIFVKLMSVVLPVITPMPVQGV